MGAVDDVSVPLGTRSALGTASPLRADADFGFPGKIAQAFDATAQQTNCIVISRAPGKATTTLIDERYDLKGFFVKAKSCDWGPMAGFVCMNPLLNKKGPENAKFNRDMHLGYLWTLHAYDPSPVRIGQPSAHPAGARPPANVLATRLANAFRPIWISDNLREQLFELRALDRHLTFDTTFEGGRSVVGIAVNAPGFPTVAVEFVLRSVAGRQLWRLYHGGVYIRAPGRVSPDSTIVGSRGGGIIILERDEEGDDEREGFPDDDGYFRIRVVVDGAAEIMLARRHAGDLIVADDGRAQSGERLEVKGGALVYPFPWRPAPLHPLLGGVAERPDDDGPRAVFQNAYGDDVAGLELNSDEAGELDQLVRAREAFDDLYDAGNGDRSPFQRRLDELRFWPIMGVQNPFPPRGGELAYLNAVSGDYDLAAVWPASRAVEMPRISERRTSPDGASSWLEAGERLFRRIPGRPFTVESMAVPGLFVEFIPLSGELDAHHLEDETFGNANSVVLEVLGWLNAFAAQAYADLGAGDREGAEATVIERAGAGATSLHVRGTTLFSKAGTATVADDWRPIVWSDIEVTERDASEKPTRWRLRNIRPSGEGSIGYEIPVGTIVKAKRRNPPNIAFHSDEGGRPNVYAVDLPSAFFLPRQIAEDVIARDEITRTPRRSFVIDEGGVRDFLSLVIALRGRAHVCLPGGWLNSLLGYRPAPDEPPIPMMWYLLHGNARPPGAGTAEAVRFTAERVADLYRQLRALVAKPARGDLPDAAERVRRALELRAP